MARCRSTALRMMMARRLMRRLGGDGGAAASAAVAEGRGESDEGGDNDDDGVKAPSRVTELGDFLQAVRGDCTVSTHWSGASAAVKLATGCSHAAKADDGAGTSGEQISGDLRGSDYSAMVAQDRAAGGSKEGPGRLTRPQTPRAAPRDAAKAGSSAGASTPALPAALKAEKLRLDSALRREAAQQARAESKRDLKRQPSKRNSRRDSDDLEGWDDLEEDSHSRERAGRSVVRKTSQTKLRKQEAKRHWHAAQATQSLASRSPWASNRGSGGATPQTPPAAACDAVEVGFSC